MMRLKDSSAMLHVSKRKRHLRLSLPKEEHSLPKSRIASLAIRVPLIDPTAKNENPMIEDIQWSRSKAQGERFLQNILDLYFKHFKLSEDVVNRILQVVLDLQHFKSSLFIFAATILQSSSAIHHISNIDNYVHQIIKFQSILITSSHSLWSSQSFGHQKGVCPWLTENHFNSQYLKHWASQSFGT
ncbi:hypothetical protein Tco_0337630 [Tanacetum coccineum]